MATVDSIRFITNYVNLLQIALGIIDYCIITIFFGRMQKNTDQKNSEYGHFLCSARDKHLQKIVLTRGKNT